jgi:hypothetical protein
MGRKPRVDRSPPREVADCAGRGYEKFDRPRFGRGTSLQDILQRNCEEAFCFDARSAHFENNLPPRVRFERVRPKGTSLRSCPKPAIHLTSQVPEFRCRIFANCLAHKQMFFAQRHRRYRLARSSP